MKKEAKEPKKMKARRNINRDTPEKAPDKKKRTLTKKHKILLAVLVPIAVLILATGILVLISSPEIDTEQNPFKASFMSMFGKPEAYNFRNSSRGEREHTLGTVYTLQDFFGMGLLVGETHPDDIIRNKNAYNILVVGKDRVGSNTDVIMVVNFDSLTQKINILQIPRDTYVDDPINKTGSKKINAIYAYAFSKNRQKFDTRDEASHASIQHLESTIEATFGITIDSYFMIDLNGFVNIIDSIGGVEVDVPFNMYYSDPEQNLYINLKKGHQLLDGNKAEQFVRFRNTYVLGDVGRVSAQKIFLAALVDKLLSPQWFSVDSLTGVASNLIKYTTTGMTLTDLVGYIKKIDFRKLSSDSITFYTAQGEGYFASSGASLYSLFIDENLEIVNKAFNLYNKDVTKSNITMSQQYRSSYTVTDTNGSTATEIGDEPPKIIVAGGGSSSSKPTTKPQTPSQEDTPTEGDTPIEGDTPVEGDTPIEGDTPVEGDAPIEGEIPVEGDTPIEGEIPVEGDTPIEGNTPIEGELPTEEDTTIEEDVPTEGEPPVEEEQTPSEEELPTEEESPEEPEKPKEETPDEYIPVASPNQLS